MSQSYTKPSTRYVWAQMATKEQKDQARELIGKIFSGREKAASIHFVNSRRHTEHAMSNFIARLEVALANKTQEASA